MSDPVRRGFCCEVTVEFEDVDSYGIAHHTKLVAYLERARLRFLVSLGLDLNLSRVVPVMYDLEMRYMKPAKILDRLDVTVFVREVNDFVIDLGYRIRRGGQTIARARTGIAFADLDAGGVVAAPEPWVEAVRAFVAGAPEGDDGDAP